MGAYTWTPWRVILDARRAGVVILDARRAGGRGADRGATPQPGVRSRPSRGPHATARLIAIDRPAAPSGTRPKHGEAVAGAASLTAHGATCSTAGRSGGVRSPGPRSPRSNLRGYVSPPCKTAARFPVAAVTRSMGRRGLAGHGGGSEAGSGGGVASQEAAGHHGFGDASTRWCLPGPTRKNRPPRLRSPAQVLDYAPPGSSITLPVLDSPVPDLFSPNG